MGSGLKQRMAPRLRLRRMDEARPASGGKFRRPDESMVMRSWRDRNPLRLWRLGKKLTQGAVAVRLGVSEQAVRDYERGGYSPTSVDAVTSVGKLLGPSREALQRHVRQWLRGVPRRGAA